MTEALTIVPWDKLIDWARDYAEDRRFKGRATVLHLRNGTLIEGTYVGYSRDRRTLLVESETGTRGVPVDNILLFEIGRTIEVSHSLGTYAFGGIPYTLSDFPKPFVQEDGSWDLTFVIGEGSRDFDDHREFLRKTGEKSLPAARIGRRGDFDYLPTLAFALGNVATSLAKSGTAESLPIARQGFVARDNYEVHNVITIGSGAVNTFTRQVLEFYGTHLPVRFGSPETDQEIVDEIGDRVVYPRKKESDWNVGMIEVVPNPFAPSKLVLIVAGVTVTGTQAGLIALSDSTTRKVLHNRVKRVGTESLTIPAQLVRASHVKYVNGIEMVDGYELIS